ncbi:hypothetical protein RJ639_046082 [Escallonia herrerae]|uniref:WRKY domain-containing protein n=1 Tax=Escallonia herrerae TaxID=1293975 RepID=A0AA89B4M6_9ASTE|nr:hypothetical protein RJ639_046082 [Escallonia herrerae]
MEKGWGLTLDNSDIDRVGFFLNKPAGGFSLNTPRLNQSKENMFSGGQFPVSLNNFREDQTAAHASPVGEVDFFSKKPNDHHHHLHSAAKSGALVVKKERSTGEATPVNGFNVNTGLHLLTANTGSDQSTVDDGTTEDNAKNELAQLQVELERMNAENQRLKGMLSQVSNNYSALQMHIVALMQQQQNSRTDSTREHEINTEGKTETKKREGGGGSMVPRQFLDLGPSGATADTDVQTQSSSEERTHSESPARTMELSKNGSESEGWVPNKVPKLNDSKTADQATDATMRKARVSVRARSEAPMITDGCQWRKYGQKMAKGNPCPRAYYRCTMAVGCPVRKQVQRCAEDRTILITTYEGNHNHPLPPAAMAMASTTSAAASTLLSGSMSSADGIMNPNLLARAILPCSSSFATISASAPFPTVTLDLTHSTNPLQFQRPPPQFPVPFPGPPPQVFGQALYNQSKFSGLQLSQEMELNQLGHHAPALQLHQQQNNPSYADTLSAATAAITTDPNFTAALAAAISSIIGGTHPTNSSNNNNNNNSNSQKTSSFQGN